MHGEEGVVPGIDEKNDDEYFETKIRGAENVTEWAEKINEKWANKNGKQLVIVRP